MKKDIFKPRLERVFKGHWIVCDGRVMASGTNPLKAVWCLLQTYLEGMREHFADILYPRFYDEMTEKEVEHFRELTHRTRF